MADNSKILSISTQEKIQLNEDIVSKKIPKGFGRKEDTIELHILAANDQIVYSESNFKEYTFPDSSQNSSPSETHLEIIINPTEILSNRGYVSGRHKLKLNIQRNKIFDSVTDPFSIKEISPSRKEVRIIAPKVSNDIFDRSVKSFISEIESSAYFRDFVLNFGDDIRALGINILLNKNPNKHELLVKLLDPLPASIKEQSTLSVVENIIDPQIIDINLGDPETDDEGIHLRAPNFKIDVRINNSIPSSFKTYNDILEFNLTSSYQRLLNQLENRDIPAIDYEYVRPVSSSTEDTDVTYHFENFVHFSNATERLKNFEYKVKLLEIYDSQLDQLNLGGFPGPYFSGGGIVEGTFDLQFGGNMLTTNFDFSVGGLGVTTDMNIKNTITGETGIITGVPEEGQTFAYDATNDGVNNPVNYNYLQVSPVDLFQGPPFNDGPNGMSFQILTTGQNYEITDLEDRKRSIEEKRLKLIAGFDGYEQFLYYESGSWATWPKKIKTNTITETLLSSSANLYTNVLHDFNAGTNIGVDTNISSGGTSVTNISVNFVDLGVQPGDFLYTPYNDTYTEITSVEENTLEYAPYNFIGLYTDWTIYQSGDNGGGFPGVLFGISGINFPMLGIEPGMMLNNLDNGTSTPILQVGSTFLGTDGNFFIPAGMPYSVTNTFEAPVPGGNLPPYELYETTSPQAQAWLGSAEGSSPLYGGQLLSASLYDKQNEHALVNLVPNHILDNPESNFYKTFVHMIGHHFDGIWTYIKAFTDINDSHHTRGISKDLVYFQLKSLGIETFDQFENSNLIEYILGNDSSTTSTTVGDFTIGDDFVIGDDSDLNNNYLSTPEGQTLVTASNEGSLPKGDITKEIWKRLYHNAPYLLKTKGTERGIKALMSVYGVPSTILNVKEYGGNTVTSGPLKNLDTADYYKTFTYEKSAFALKGDSGKSGYFLHLPWSSSLGPTIENPNYSSAEDPNLTTAKAHTIEMRIKPVRTDKDQVLLFFSASSTGTWSGSSYPYQTLPYSPNYPDYDAANPNAGFSFSNELHNGGMAQYMYIEPYSGSDILTTDDASQYGKLVYRYAGGFPSNAEYSLSQSFESDYFPIYNGDFWLVFAGLDATNSDSGSDHTPVEFGAYQSNFLKNVSFYTQSAGVRKIGTPLPSVQNGIPNHYHVASWGIGLSSGILSNYPSGGAAKGIFICGASPSGSWNNDLTGVFDDFGGEIQGNIPGGPYDMNGNNYIYKNVTNMPYSGSLQEVRFYRGELLSHKTLIKHALEPFMYGGNSVSSSYDHLYFRGALGSNDQQDSSSFHPNIEYNYLNADTNGQLINPYKIGGGSDGFTKAWIVGEDTQNNPNWDIFTGNGNWYYFDNSYFSLDEHQGAIKFNNVGLNGYSDPSMQASAESVFFNNTYVYLPCNEVLKKKTYKVKIRIKNLKKGNGDNAFPSNGYGNMLDIMLFSPEGYSGMATVDLGKTIDVPNRPGSFNKYLGGKTDSKGNRIYWPDSSNSDANFNSVGFYDEPAAKANDLAPNSQGWPQGTAGNQYDGNGYAGIWTKAQKPDHHFQYQSYFNYFYGIFPNLFYPEPFANFGPFDSSERGYGYFAKGQNVIEFDDDNINANETEIDLSENIYSDEGVEYEFLIKIDVPPNDDPEYQNWVDSRGQGLYYTSMPMFPNYPNHIHSQIFLQHRTRPFTNYQTNTFQDWPYDGVSYDITNLSVELVPQVESTLTSSLEWEETLENHYHLTPDTVGISMTSEKTRLDEGTVNDDILSTTIKSENSTLDRQPQDFEDLGVFFSPTTEINEDIMYTLGAFRLDDYIGSPLPSAQTASNYEDLKEIKDIYFKKVRRNRYNYWDYIKLVQYMDHTLFKLVEQFVPFKANTKTGLLIEPHYLERTKFARELPVRMDGQTMTTGSHHTFDFQIDPEKAFHLNSSSLGGGSAVSYAGMVSNQLDNDNRFRKDIGTNTTINVSGYVLDQKQNIAQAPIKPDSTGSNSIQYKSDVLLGNAPAARLSRIYYRVRPVPEPTNMDINQFIQQ